MSTAGFDMQPQLLEDGLIKITPLTANDFEQLFITASDPAIWEQHPEKDRYKRDVFQRYFDSAVKSQSAFLVFEKSTSRLIACTRYLHYEPATSKIEIGYTFLAKAFWRSEE